MNNSPRKITELLIGQVLDQTYIGVCSCYYKRDYGYMGTTAHADKQYHESKGHTFTVTGTPAEPLTAKVCVRLMRMGRKNRTVSVSSDML